MPAKTDPQHEDHQTLTAVENDGSGVGERTGSRYFYRRSLSSRELLPAIGVGIAAGLFAFYVTRTLIQRTPFVTGAGRDGGRGEGRNSRRLTASDTNGG